MSDTIRSYEIFLTALRDIRQAGEVPVLDHGFVRLLDMMPNSGSYETPEERIAAAARVPTSKSYPLLNDKTNTKLLDHLFRSGHTSPFKTVEFLFQVKAPVMVARQWLRRYTGIYNEQSGICNYDDTLEFYMPQAWYRQSETNKQGRSEAAVTGDFTGRYEDLIAASVQLYNDLRAAGVANEMARMVLPANSLYTTFTYKTNLLNLLRFLEQRVDPAAPFEVRQYALVVLNTVQTLMPALAACQEKYQILVPRKVGIV